MVSDVLTFDLEHLPWLPEIGVASNIRFIIFVSGCCSSHSKQVLKHLNILQFVCD